MRRNIDRIPTFVHRQKAVLTAFGGPRRDAGPTASLVEEVSGCLDHHDWINSDFRCRSANRGRGDGEHTTDSSNHLCCCTSAFTAFWYPTQSETVSRFSLRPS